jgi:hypothetical protein
MRKLLSGLLAFCLFAVLSVPMASATEDQGQAVPIPTRELLVS